MASPINQSGPSLPPGAPAAVGAEVPNYPPADRPIHAIFSFVVDATAQFAYQGYHLAQSLREHAVSNPADVHVQFTPPVGEPTREVFRQLGCTVHSIEPFGDGRFCNKLSQFDHLLDCPCDRIVLLDTDTILISDPRPQLGPEAVLAKIVDFGNPPLQTLAEIAAAAGLADLPAPVSTDAGEAMTFPGNCNGGFYSIPVKFARTIAAQWRKWAAWMLEHMAPLKRVRAENHLDQVAMWLTLHKEGIPFQACRANLNYFIHYAAPHRYYDPRLPISVLHYHDTGVNVVGLIQPALGAGGAAAEAVRRANAQIGRHFNNRLFWDLRYEKFPQRGSGVGSQGKNLEIKRKWLAKEGIESAASVLDVGCGNLEVVKAFNPKNYLGLDQSEAALAVARKARPDWSFAAVDVGKHGDEIPAADLVICFEVLIHQETADAYHRLIRFLAAKTNRKLIVTGYERPNPATADNHMIFFYEALQKSLADAGKFKKIEPIGTHSDLTAFRCEV